MKRQSDVGDGDVGLGIGTEDPVRLESNQIDRFPDCSETTAQRLGKREHDRVC